MPDHATSNVLILACDAAAASRWAEALAGREVEICLDPNVPPEPGQLELILTDADATPPDAETLGRWPLAAIHKSMVGVIRIGGEGHADARLPVDATQREIDLACRLVTQIVRLRRSLRSRAENESRLAQEVLLDPLTGLPNRRAWDESLTERLRNPPNEGIRLCVAVFDLDHFKVVNDASGHPAGDAVLRAAGEAIRDGLRHGDFVSRLGGDEFGLLLWVPDCEAAAAVVDRVRRQVPERLKQSGSPVVTASAGYWLASDSPAPLPSPDAAFELADSALREAKREGRDRTCGL